MLLRRISIENVRSFLERQELLVDGQISIVIGPNGGGKTNLLDATVAMLRRHLFAAPYFAPIPTDEEPDRWDIRQNDQLNQLTLEKHSSARNRPQIIEIEVEVTEVDIKNMIAIKTNAAAVIGETRKRFVRNPLEPTEKWDAGRLRPKDRITYTLRDSRLEHDNSDNAVQFLQYLQLFEVDNQLRSETGKAALQMPLAYLPVNRSGGGFQSRIALAGFNDYEQKRTSDATSSKTGHSILNLAIGRLAAKFRRLQEDDNTSAKAAFHDDENLKLLTKELRGLGYEWDLKTVNPLSNEYDITLKKQGTSFLVSAASSGERELLTYLFAIYALNMRDALIIVDEPELHLHPKWQKALLALFERLSKSTGNQFLLATHSPTFVSPASIQYVSRVYSDNQRSRIIRLNSATLPNAKALFNIVNSQNNERVFFCDKVVLVEGLSDRIFFERVLDLHTQRGERADEKTIEIVSVSGKGLFDAYSKVLEACQVETEIIADLDYIEQIGDDAIKQLFVTNTDEIKDDVIKNMKSLDGGALVSLIDAAMASGSWADAQDLWAYIKSSRRRLKSALSEPEQVQLDKFIAAKAAQGTYVLRQGALEDYLPEGYRAKDIEKLISLVSVDGFWEVLPDLQRDDVQKICDRIMPLRPQAARISSATLQPGIVADTSAPCHLVEAGSDLNSPS
jgi:putative ATP-dependent endonuclease of OLD family